MRTKGTFVVLCILALLWAVPAMAQEQSGAIEGIVKDTSGGVLPGVTIEARNVSTSAMQTAVTDAEGRYRFPALPPGKYEVTAKLQGFGDKKIAGDLALGQLLKIEITMAVAGVAETVQVTGEAPLIDTKQAASFTTVSKDVIDRIPKSGRDFSSVVTTAAGAQDESRSGGIQVDGSSGSENRFIIDGMDTTNLQGGTQGKTMLFDFIQEVQVKSSGYNAEFGGSTGGVLSAITKSGSNNFRGSAGIYNQGDWGYGDRRGYHRLYPYAYGGNASAFTGEGTNCVTTGLMQGLGAVTGSTATSTRPAGAAVPCVGNSDLLNHDTPWTYLSPVADLGGPVLKDKLWFYGGWSYTKNSYTRDATFLNDPQQVNRHFSWYDWANYINYNATSQLNNNVRVKFNGSNQRNKNRGGAPTLQPDNDPLGFPYQSSYPWIAAGTSMQGYTRDSLPLINGQLDQATFDRTYVLNGGDSWNNTYSGNVDWVVSPTFFINATAGYFMYNNTTPADVRFNDIRYIYNNTPCVFSDVPSSFCQGGNGWSNTQLSSSGTEKNIFNRIFVNVNGTYFRSMKGQHTFKTGLRYERFANDVRQGLTYPQITIYWDQDYSGTRGKYGYYDLVQNGTVGNIHSNNYSLWFQDTWSLNNKLTINAGVRMENEYVPSYKGDVPDCNVAPNDPNCALSIKFGMGDKIAPRLGFAYDVKGDSKWKAYGSYSWYYDITKLELPRGSFGGDHWIDYYWTLDTYDYTKIRCGEGNTGCPGTFISSTDWRHSSNQVDQIFSDYFNRPGMTGIDPNLKPVRSGDFQLGLDHELNPTMSLGFRYIHKWQNRTIEDVGIYAPDLASDPSGQTLVEDYLISNPGEGYAAQMEPRFPSLIEPKPKRNYDAFEVHLRKRLAHNWAADATYTYSRLYGNYPGLASSDEWGRNSPNVNRLWDNTVMSYDINQNLVYGVLNTDRPHAFKLSGSYDFNFGTSVGAFWLMQSGLPNSTVFRASNGGYPVFPYGRNDMGRLPFYKNLDLVLTHQIKMGGNKRLALQANFTNVLDLKGVTNYYYLQYGNVLTQSRTNIGLPITYFYAGNLGNYVGGQTYPAGAYTVQNAAYLYTLPKSAGGAYGGALWDNPFYGVNDQYQGRRQIRISAKFTF